MIQALRLPAARRRPIERFHLLTAAISLVAPIVVIATVAVLYTQASAAVTRFGAGFLVATSWNPVTLDFGALPFIYGTLVSSAIALVLAVPVGVATGIALAEPGARGLRAVIGRGVELLAAIPSVVYGIWALFVMAPFVYDHLELPLSRRLPFIPVFSGRPQQTSLLSAALVLAIMILPTLTAVSRDILASVPKGLRESAIALGATWWEATWRVILPAARAGIFGAVILALGRALGETIAVTMVIGNRPQISVSLFAPAYTLASVIANEFTEATGAIYPAALIELGLALILMTLAINLLAQLLVRRAQAAR
jgi:phosphate transport system permease protein